MRALRTEGWTVFAVARRADRLEALAAETGAVALPADVTDDADVARLVDEVTRAGGIDTLINIAGGARGADKVAEAKTEDWEWMYRGQRAGHHETHPGVPAHAARLRRGNRPEPDLDGRDCPPMRAAAATTRPSSPSTP